MQVRLKGPLGCVVVASLFLGAVLVTAIVTGAKEDPYLAEVALPGSSDRLRLLQMTDGPLKYDWKPSRFSGLIPRPGTVYVPAIHVNLDGLDRQTDQPGHTFLFRAVNSSGSYANPNLTTFGFEFVESTGFVFRRFGFADFPHWGVSALTRSCLPRRDKELTIRIKPDSNKKAFVEMKVPNPVYREQIPVWEPEPLPIKKTVEDLTAHLEGIHYHGSPQGSGYIYCQIRGESRLPEWTNGGFVTTFEDATGNQGQEISPFEPAWKVVARAYRNWGTPFPLEFVSSRVKIPILGPSTVQKLDQVLSVDDQKFRLRCVAGPGVTSETLTGFEAQPNVKKPQDGQHQYTSTSFNHTGGRTLCTSTSVHHVVWIESEPPKKHDQIVIQLVSADGSITPCQTNTSMSSTNSTTRHLMIADLKPPSPDVQEIELQIAVSRPRIVEFMVAPPEEARTYWKSQAASAEGESP